MRMKHAGLAFGAWLLVACAPPHAATPPATGVVEGAVTVVRDSILPASFEAAGLAEPVQRAVVSTRLMARVVEVLVQEGEAVLAGQLLARLDAAELEAKREQVLAGQAAAEAARTEALTFARRIRALYADSAAPRAQLDQAEAGLARAEAAVRQAAGSHAELEALASYAELRAPFAGMVARRMVDAGGFAAPGQPLLVIEDQSRLRIAVSASPDLVQGLARGTELAGTVSGMPVRAVVEGVAPAPGGHLVVVNALVDNRAHAFAGSAATLLLPRGERHGLVIPESAVIREGDLTGVWIRSAGAADLRWVRLGRASAGWVEVVAGLAGGDSVLIAPHRGGGE